ncbi:MAG: thiol:disulfide interchange protein DsbA/DsbL [Thiotrichales bacterium]
MQRFLNSFLLLVFLCAPAVWADSGTTPGAGSTAATTYQQGVHYELLKVPQPTEVAPGKIEVREIFSYSCPHCWRLEAPLEKWKATMPDDVELITMPGILAKNWMLLGKTYYALEAIGQLDAMHKRFFDAIHLQGRRFTSLDSLVRFFSSEGIDGEKFRSAMNSMVVNTKARHAESLVKKYEVTGVPALIVGGKYQVLNSGATTYEELMDVVTFLVNKERASQK